MKKLLMAVALIAVIGCRHSETNEEIMIPFAGIDGGLNSKQMEKNIAKPLRKSSEKIIKQLDKVSSEETNDWELTRIAVGLFLVGESEFTNVYKLEVEPSVELRFQQL